MELKHVDSSRLVALMTVQPKEGQPYLPDVVAAVVERYRFQKYPSSFEEFVSEVKTFKIGVWDGVQIEEMSAYNDGVIIAARCQTDTLDEFCDDLIALMAEFGLERDPMPTDARHYESALIVQFDPKILSKLAFLDAINADLAEFQRSYGLGAFQFQPASIESSVDAMTCVGKRPVSFNLIRRVGVPFDANIWFSAAPLKTADHLTLLRKLEEVMSS